MRYLGHEYITPEMRFGFRRGVHPGFNDIGSAVMAGASVLGSVIGADAAGDAAETQANAARRASDIDLSMFNQTRSDLEPWRQAGGAALNKIMTMLGLQGTGFGTPEYQQIYDRKYKELDDWHQETYGMPLEASGDVANLTAAKDKLRRDTEAEYRTIAPDQSQSGEFGSLLKNFSLDDLAKDPIFALTKDFQLEEVENMLTKAASARGETDSGVLMKDLLKYGTNVLNTLGGDAYNRFNTNKTLGYNFLAPVANVGQQTGVQLGQMGQVAAGNIGNNITGAGNAIAAGQVGSANAWNQGISGAINTYQNQELLKRFGGGGAVAPQQAPAPVYDAQPSWVRAE